MANVAGPRDGGESATLAALLDPVALEARLADARARRAVALAYRTGPATDAAAPADEGPLRPTAFLGAGCAAGAAGMIRAPRVRLVAAFLLAGLAAAAAGVVLAPHFRPAVAPEVALTTVVPAQPAPVASAPASGAAAVWPETTPAPPELAALALSPLKLPPPRPVRLAAAPPTAPSRVRAAGAFPADAAPVLAEAAASAVLSVISRDADDLVRQLGKVSREVVNGAVRGNGGESLVRSIRRATAALQGKPRPEGRAVRRALDQIAPGSRDGPRAAPTKSGPSKQAERRGGSKSKGADKKEGKSASRGRDRGGDRGRGRDRDDDDDDDD